MRIEIQFNGVYTSIDSVDSDLLGKWLIEMFERQAPFNNSDWIQVRAYPSWVRDQAEWTGRVIEVQIAGSESPSPLLLLDKMRKFVEDNSE